MIFYLYDFLEYSWTREISFDKLAR